MDDAKRYLKGSKTRDIFRWKHKQLNPQFFACDGDLILVSKIPPGTVAYLDYKTTTDFVSFAEAIQYNEWMKEAPVYVVESDYPRTGPFTIKRYLGANWKPEPPIVNWGDVEIVENWAAFGEWEQRLRKEYRRRGGWRGLLRGPDSRRVIRNGSG
jgi:hypothetical protein